MVYLFNKPKNTACIVCNHVINRDIPILYAFHDEEDVFWQFLCGRSDHTEIDYKLISLEEIVVIEQSVNYIHDIPLDNSATRDTELCKWKI